MKSAPLCKSSFVDNYSPSLLIFPFRTADAAIYPLLSSSCSSGSKTNQTQSLNVKISPTFSRQDWHFLKKHAAESPFSPDQLGSSVCFIQFLSLSSSLPVLFWSLMSSVSCQVSHLCDWFACANVFHLCRCAHLVYIRCVSLPLSARWAFFNTQHPECFPGSVWPVSCFRPLSLLEVWSFCLIICLTGSLIWTSCLCFQASEPDTFFCLNSALSVFVSALFMSIILNYITLLYSLFILCFL